MAYLIDRQRALRTVDIVAIVAGTRRGERGHVTLRDNSLHRTASRPKTLVSASQRYPEAVARHAVRRGVSGAVERARSKGAAWWKPQ